jgi:hypothetical protein
MRWRLANVVPTRPVFKRGDAEGQRRLGAPFEPPPAPPNPFEAFFSTIFGERARGPLPVQTGQSGPGNALA